MPSGKKFRTGEELLSKEFTTRLHEAVKFYFSLKSTLNISAVHGLMYHMKS